MKPIERDDQRHSPTFAAWLRSEERGVPLLGRYLCLSAASDGENRGFSLIVHPDWVSSMEDILSDDFPDLDVLLELQTHLAGICTVELDQVAIESDGQS